MHLCYDLIAYLVQQMTSNYRLGNKLIFFFYILHIQIFVLKCLKG